ncbi:Cationic amino acid transporter 2, vacuolar [Camellia lanceoleosa]|uniref:Cationic amino acid transporter 2, vacuolar n=1 Tax=Camellia lanceoleosa TaxID=1840588 RepID=A0ACC0FP09_9ERIC|nr:Cationic amino acid transporter 2, vacuolar [Camellia lanceoleosa]
MKLEQAHLRGENSQHVAWSIGWALILEYTIGGSAVARCISPNLYLPGLDIVVDPCAALLVIVVTGLLCLGIKEYSRAIHCHNNKCLCHALYHYSQRIFGFQDWMGWR